MNLAKLIRLGAGKAVKHSPKILTVLSVMGVISTAKLASDAGVKSNAVIIDLRNQNPEVTKKELAKAVVPVYIPTLLMGGATIGCMIGATTVASKRNAVLASLYSATELALKQYQEKTFALDEGKTDKRVRDAVAKELVESHPVRTSEVIVTGKGKSLCYDSLSGRYFESDIDTIKRAMNRINRAILSEMWITLNQFYDELGLTPIQLGDRAGWNVDNMLDLKFSSQIASDGRPCIVVGYYTEPIPYDYL